MTRLWAACATHHRVPVAQLELFPRGDQLPGVLTRLSARAGVEGALVLSTCNRYEVYLSTERCFSRPELTRLIGDTADVDPDVVADSLDVHSGDDVVHHLFSVSAGLDSRAPGEGEILGQLRTAAQTAGARGHPRPRAGDPRAGGRHRGPARSPRRRHPPGPFVGRQRGGPAGTPPARRAAGPVGAGGRGRARCCTDGSGADPGRCASRRRGARPRGRGRALPGVPRRAPPPHSCLAARGRCRHLCDQRSRRHPQ